MHKPIIIFLFLLSSKIIFADEFEIIKFYASHGDLAATRNPQKDIDGKTCALIKVLTDIQGMDFDANGGIAADVVQKSPGEYWLYVSPGEKAIKLMHRDFKPEWFQIPGSVESGRVYILEVKRKGGAVAAIDENLITLTFRLNEPGVFISRNNAAPVQVEGKSVADFQLPPGEYTFRFTKDGFEDITKSISVEKDQIVDINLQQGAATTRLNLPGILSIYSAPDQAEVFLNGQKVGFTPFTDQLIAGEYQLMLMKELYYSYSGTFTLQEGETKELPLINLKPRFGYIEVISTPSGADVYLDNKLIGQTPVARREIESGEHTLRTEFNLYHDKTETFTIEDGDDRSFNLELVPAFGQLNITSEPEGAAVYIDEQMVGSTPFLKDQWPSGIYKLRLTRELWTDETETIEVKDGQQTERLIVLTKNFGTVKVNAQGATILQDERQIAKDSYQANLKPGSYNFKAVKDKHRDAEKKIYITIGSNEEITLEPEPIMGSVSVFSEPMETKGANIFINGNKRKENTPAVIPLIIGNYDIKIEKQGFLEASKNVTVKEGENQKLTFQMQTYQGSLQQEYRKHKIRKWAWLGAAAASAGAGTYFYLSANQKYDEYKTATGDATKLHNQVETFDIIYPVLYGISAACLVPAIIYASKQGKVKRKMNVAVMPLQDGAVFSIAYTF
ncbi:MAG: PEGA domain-containing protein [Bacteroidetes bacterium]|nr:PEGA domain-containing protein [Bacteroidota bacterium]